MTKNVPDQTWLSFVICINVDDNSFQNQIIILDEGIKKPSWNYVLYLNKVSINSEAIQSKSSSFITAEDIHSSHFFNCSHSFCNGTLKKRNERQELETISAIVIGNGVKQKLEVLFPLYFMRMFGQYW